MNRALLSPPVSSIEILEGRIAPAAVLVITDFDGDSVKITSSRGTVADLQAALTDHAGDGFSLTLGTVFRGANISIVAGASESDAAVVNVGFINAAGVDLGNISVDGELNRIVAGDSNSRTAGMRALRVGTFGVTDVTPGDATDQFDSKVIGALTSLTVRGDMTGASLRVLGSNFGLPDDDTGFDGRIGSIFIGGSLLGTARENGGAIFASGNMGNVQVLGNITGFTGANARVADGQDYNASIVADGAIGNITVGGDLTGGDGDFSGHIASGLGMKALSLRNLIGGHGSESGVVGSSGTLGKVTIAENVIGGSGYRSGSILSLASMQAVNVGKMLQGGAGEASGWIAAGGALASVTIGQGLPAGSSAVIGGDGEFSGSVGARGSVGAVKIFGDLVGGDGASSGQVVSANKIASVTIDGDLVGGTAFETGAIGSLQGLGAILIKGNIIAGSGERSAFITTQKASYDSGEAFIAAPIASVTVLGSIVGGEEIEVMEPIPGAELGGLSPTNAGPYSAGILASGNLGAVVVKGDVRGGYGYSSGRIAATGDIKSVTIEGSLIGGDGSATGAIAASGALGAVTLGGNLEGGFGDFSGTIFSATNISKVTIGGNIFGGLGFGSGSIETSNESSSPADMGAIFVAGSVVGNDGNRSGSINSGGKIASITIGDPKVPVETEIGVPIPNELPLGNGSLIGGFGHESGSITARGDIGSVVIKYNLDGGAGDRSGRVYTGGKLTSLAVGLHSQGSIQGGSGSQTYGYDYGQVYAREAIGKVAVGGNIEGGDGDFTAHIRGRSVGSVTVAGSIYGGAGEASGSIFSYSLDIGSVKVGNSLVAGTGGRSGWIAAEGSIGSVEATYLSGNSGARPRISAVEKISAVTIRHTASLADIFAGYNTEGQGVNGDAQIGTVKVLKQGNGLDSSGGNIFGVNIVAGVLPDDAGDFGTTGNQAIPGASSTPHLYSKIASVIIAGDVLSAGGGSGSFGQHGIVAQHIVSLKVGGSAKSLTSGAGNDLIPQLAGSAPDTSYLEVPTSQVVFVDPFVIDQFDPDQGSLVGAAFDATTGNVWIYGSFAPGVRSYSATGGFLSSIARPGESADDVDIEFAPESLTLGGTVVPAGTLLFINGESGFAEIYAVDKATGTVLATLNTGFGASHVVGGSYHAGRNTFFLVQDHVPGSTDGNRVAEIDPATGNVLSSFQTTGAFVVNFGDIEASTVTGNLFIVGSNEANVAEFTPDGSLVSYHPLPAGVSGVSGIGLDDAQGEAWLSTTNGVVYRIGNLPTFPF